MRPRPHSGHGARGTMQVAEIRQHVCSEAARIMAEEGVTDFHAAKRRATQRLALPEGHHLPSNAEVEQALRQYLALFHAARLTRELPRLRRIALAAMRFFSAHEPRLVGTVLSGTVTPGTEIQLHVSADTPEEIGFLLAEHHIPWEEGARTLRFGDDRHETVPAYRFLADEVPIEACVFTRTGAREIPLSPVDGRPMKRANLKEVEALLTDAPAPPAPSPRRR